MSNSQSNCSADEPSAKASGRLRQGYTQMLNSGVQNSRVMEQQDFVERRNGAPRSYLFPNDDGTYRVLLDALVQKRLLVLDLSRLKSYSKLLDNPIFGSSYGLGTLSAGRYSCNPVWLQLAGYPQSA